MGLRISSFLRGRWLWRYVTGAIRAPPQATGETEENFNERLENWDSKSHHIRTCFQNTSIP